MLLSEAQLRLRSSTATACDQGGSSPAEARKCPATWWVSVRQPALARVATGILRDELRRRRQSGYTCGQQGEPTFARAFADARAEVAAQLWAELQSVRQLQCQRAQVIWSRRLAKSLLQVLANASGWAEFEENGGFLVFNRSLDWTTLLLARREAEGLLEDAASDAEDEPGEAGVNRAIRLELSSIDLLQNGCRCLYAAARVCRLALEHVGASPAKAVAGMAVGDGLLVIERRLPLSERSKANALLSLACPAEPFAQWRVPLAVGSLQREVFPAGGSLLLCGRMPRFVKSLQSDVLDEDEPPWIRVSV
eukprot:gnl/TRDRNA2_/TRDRNA2_171876_c0_seq2.p1 gnl/TRDRNA2_/TRDRNA2_171876_c0~~gnl/TRDRNA2_/TRDRNA2_171876_c0_seq2.p1  ORF type:complete len:308 (-),score=54.76 gnl/TRDRNA2_/TRDRNA2_171876_c0_seq2:28-951(-)